MQRFPTLLDDWGGLHSNYLLLRYLLCTLPTLQHTRSWSHSGHHLFLSDSQEPAVRVSFALERCRTVLIPLSFVVCVGFGGGSLID
jgi:hypothetical protein